MTSASELGINAIDLCCDLRLAAGKLFRLPQDGFPPRVEQSALTFDLFGHVVARGGKGDQIGRERQVGLVVTLCFQPGAAGANFVKLRLDDAVLRSQERTVQRQNNVACANNLPFADDDFCNHATIGMLDDLTILVDLDLARGDDGTVKF